MDTMNASITALTLSFYTWTVRCPSKPELYPTCSLYFSITVRKGMFSSSKIASYSNITQYAVF